MTMQQAPSAEDLNWDSLNFGTKRFKSESKMKLVVVYLNVSWCVRVFHARSGCNKLAQREVSAGIPSGQRESRVWRTFLAAFASLAFDPSQPSLVKEHNPPNMDLNKQCNP